VVGNRRLRRAVSVHGENAIGESIGRNRLNITAEKCETVIVKNNFLKDKQDPASAVNRRVQIINLGR
jgi:hypothetical protein